MTLTGDERNRSKAHQRRDKANAVAEATRRGERRRSLVAKVAVALVAALVVGGLFAIYRSGSAGTSTATSKPGSYDVGSPGAGKQAPDFALTATDGRTVRLSEFRGQNVLVYMHEGLGCQPCWDQIRDLEANEAKLKAAGIDRLVSITSAPADLVGQKMRDEGLTSLALGDPDLDAIRAYGANKYGMMGDATAGHTFLLVNGGGKIDWRADYGGPPKFTMYLPADRILADLDAGRAGR